MVDVANVVNLQITRETRIPTVAGLETIAILSKEAVAHFGADERVKTYGLATALESLIADGFSSSDETYLAVSAIASQSPRPINIKVIRQDADAAKQVYVLLGGGNVGAGDYKVTIDGTDFDHNEPDNTRSITDILTSIAALIDANADYSASVPVGEAYIEVTGPDGVDYAISGNAPDDLAFDFRVETPVVNAVSSIQAASDSDDDWYFLLDTTHTKAQAEAIAKYIETTKKLYFYQTDDAVTLNSTLADDQTGVVKALKDLNYDRAVGFVTSDLQQYKNAAWLAGRSVVQPGSSTWKFKSGNGISADNLSAQQVANINNKNGNEYIALGGTGVSIFQEGVVASGEYIDIIRGTDALEGRIQQLVLSLFASEAKVPFTDGGIESVGLQVEQALNEYVTFGLLVGADTVDADNNSLGPNVVVPTRAETSAADRAQRTLNGITFTANYAGAVHRTTIRGRIEV